MPHVLYRFYTATGQLLYVGITMNPAKRFKAHRGQKDWWSDVAGITIEHYATRQELANAERRAIQVEHPLHNVIRAKPKPAPTPTPEPQTGPQAATPDPFPAQLFSQQRWFNTRYGYVTQSRYEEMATAARERDEKRRTCTLCDQSGYRGAVVCDHVDRSSSTAAEAKNRIRSILRRTKVGA